MNRRIVSVVVVLCAMAGGLIAMQPAQAFKPYTHVKVADVVWNDVTADGSVTIEGRSYAVDPRVVNALRNHRAFYNGGTIGPDGFPDLVYGQSYIHPEHTGKWLKFILAKAWAAQSDPSYSPAEREQILAFAYGFMTHAAADMWAHTFVNSFAEGVFPSVSGILNGIDDPMIAIRHFIVEGYIGDATEGYDGNPARGPVPGEFNEDGDAEYSDDSTPGISFDAPHRFVYETLVNPNNVLPVGVCGDGIDDDTDGVVDDGCPGGPYTADGGPDANNDGEPDGDGPEADRGKLIDYFLNMRARLQIDEKRFEFDSGHTDCLIIDPDCYSRTKVITVNTVRGITTTSIGYNNCEGAIIGCLADPIDAVADLVDNIVEGYLEAWIDDIDTALRHWSELGLASTKALFDPRTHRAAQNFECRNKVGSESDPSSQRSLCEEGIGLVDTLSYASSDFVTNYLLSAAGAPDFVGSIAEVISALSNLLSDIFGPFNPLAVPLQAISEFVKDLIKAEIEKALGVNLDQLKSFLTTPSYWLEVGTTSITLPGVGTINARFFNPPQTHIELDRLLGLTGNHHGPQTIKLPGGGTVQSSGLNDSAVFDPEVFAAWRNSVTQSKLLLLDSAGLNAMTKDALVAGGIAKPSATVGLYSGGIDSTNVMFTGLGATEPWLRLIDGDHQWRSDGQPVFCDEGSPGCTGAVGTPTPRPARLNGGNGNYPLWESCLARPAFRQIYRDWENANPAQQFPDYGDTPSADPSDAAPTATISLSGNTFTSGTTTYVGAAHQLAVNATDATFVDSALSVSYRITKDGSAPGAWTSIANGATFSVPPGGGDGLYRIEARVEDPCHTFVTSDALPDGGIALREVVLDTTPPTITITSPSPEGVVFDTDDFSSITWTITDAGSGVNAASVSATFDGTPATQGQVIDTYLLAPGAHQVVVAGADNLGNSASLTRRFEVHATSASLLNNVARACTENSINKQGICKSLSSKLEKAIRDHTAGDHTGEHRMLEAWINEIEAQLAKSIDPVVGNRFIAFARDLIATNG